MKKKVRGWLVLPAAVMLALGASYAHAAFHLFKIQQIYSNADGTVQFVVLKSAFDNEQRWEGHYISAATSFTFPGDLPSEFTAGKFVLVATRGFADLGVVAPDYIVPNQFISTVGGTVDFAGVDSITYAAGELPLDGVNALLRTGGTGKNLATNFAGASASVGPSGPPVTANYQGLWWKAPAGSEDGWGINFAHQGATIFGTWFTYDTTGKGWWLTLIVNDNATPGVYKGDVFATTGPPFNSVPFVKPPSDKANDVGEAILTFSDANNGSFHYVVNLPGGPVSQTKALTRQSLGAAPFATCSFGTQPNLAAATNYQDIWWAGTSANPGTEGGWGINFTHQGDIVFVSWFTYDLDRTPLWLVATLKKDAPGVYSGDLYLPSGPRFDAYDKSQFRPGASVGHMKVTFANGNNATFDYEVQLTPTGAKVIQQKSITRQLFSPSGTTCQ